MRRSQLPTVFLLAVAGLVVAGCSSMPSFPSLSPSTPEPAQPAVVPSLPPAFPPQDIVGRWGLAAYHKDEDRERTELAAQAQCKQPYVITAGPTGGVIMHLADQSTPEELRLKGAPGGKTYVGPEGEPGGQQDREVVSFNGRILILRWMDPEVQGRYGTMVYVRCAPEGAKPPPKKKPAQKKPPAAPATPR
ncbi:MAG: hypothetical protein JO205_14190 [Pseudolabrys sp.]|nr:hypothetical protein [Pseudolabrys sp.]